MAGNELQRTTGGNGAPTPGGGGGLSTTAGQTTNLADVLERVLDKGVVIAGDIQINLLDIELLTIRLRLIVASVDTARRMGINWWETDPMLRSGERDEDQRSLRERVRRLERQLEGESEDGDRSLPAGEADEDPSALREQITRLERRLERMTESDAAPDE
jgi:hypothetical protein